ncbi:MAG: hypothetical protein R3Y06_10135 [Faecalibacterium sp.]
MKCPACHAPLMIEDAYCRYCGNKNPYFTMHREDLKEFTEEFKETQQEVVQKATHVNQRSIRVAIVCVLIFLNLFLFIACSSVSNCRVSYKTWQTNQNETEIRATLEEYSDTGDILAMDQYFLNDVIIYGSNLSDYYMVYHATGYYASIFECTYDLLLLRQDGYISESTCEYLGNYLVSFYDCLTPDEDDPEEWYNEEHTATLTMLQEKLEVLLEGHLNIPAEDIPTLLELSDLQRTIAIKEAVSNNEF